MNSKSFVKIISFSALNLFFVQEANCQEWQQIGQWTSFQPGVFELFADSVDNLLYFGGRFDSVNQTHTGNICTYDGKLIKSLKIGVNDCWNLGCGGVFTIGRFNDEICASLIRSVSSSDSNLMGIGSWNGQKWNSMGKGIESGISFLTPADLHDFHIWNDTLFVAGWFTRVDDLPATGVAAWNGVNWHTFQVPKDPNNGEVLAAAVAVYKNYLYMGGNFKLPVNGVDIYDMARYDGTEWSAFGGGLKGGGANLADMEVFDGKLYICGHFTKQAGNQGNCIMAWDCEKWDDLGGGATVAQGFTYVNKMTVHKGKLYVVGYFDTIGGISAQDVAVWDGQTWCSIGNSIFDEDPKGIAVYNDTVFVCGGFNSISGFPVRQLAKFIGDPANNICGTVDTEANEPVTSNIEIFPNPATQAIRITLPELPKASEVQVFNALGQLAYQAKHETLPEPAIVLEVEAWASGVYFVEVRAGDGWVWCGRFLRG